jgi:hypothetical protein
LSGYFLCLRDLALAYQFGALILAAVVPAALWVLPHRRFLERLRRRADGVAT